MTQGRCPKDGVVTLVNGRCPYCGATDGITLWADAQMAVMQHGIDGMTNMDARPDGPNLETQSLVQKEGGWKLKKTGRCTTPGIICGGTILILLPMVFAYGQIDHSDGTYTPTQTIGKVISPIAIIVAALMIFWWYRVWQRGGVPTIGQERGCDYSYSYYEKPKEGKEGFIKSLLFSEFKRYNKPSCLEPVRAIMFVVVMIVMAIASVVYTFTTKNGCPSCQDN